MTSHGKLKTKESKSPLLLIALLIICLIISSPISNAFRQNADIASRGTINYPSVGAGIMIFENWKYSPSLYAEKADMYMCHVEKAAKIRQIHQVRPDFICLIYRNMRAVKEYETSEYQMFLSNDWILKDAYGTRIKSTVFNYWIVDIGNPGYQTWVANWIKNNLDLYEADGVFLDNCLPSTEIMWSTDPGPPINPRTGKAYTDEEFEQATILVVNKTKDAIGSRLVIGNGIFRGEMFFSSSRNPHYVDLLTKSRIDGIESEGWLMSGDSPQWYSVDRWLYSIEFVRWLEDNFLTKGKVFLPVCQNIAPYSEAPAVLPTGCTSEQYALYCFASLLLAIDKNNTHYINFGYYIDDFAANLSRTELGQSLNAYYTVNGTQVYARDFSKVKVLVNPTNTQYQISLAGTYETFQGQPITSPIILQPHTGVILRRI